MSLFVPTSWNCSADKRMIQDSGTQLEKEIVALHQLKHISQTFPAEEAVKQLRWFNRVWSVKLFEGMCPSCSLLASLSVIFCCWPNKIINIIITSYKAAATIIFLYFYNSVLQQSISYEHSIILRTRKNDWRDIRLRYAYLVFQELHQKLDFLIWTEDLTPTPETDTKCKRMRIQLDYKFKGWCLQSLVKLGNISNIFSIIFKRIEVLN